MSIRVTKVRQLKAIANRPSSAWLQLTLDREIINEAGYFQFTGMNSDAFDFGRFVPTGRATPTKTKSIRVGFSVREVEEVKAILKQNPLIRVWLSRMVEVA